jgi:hypothetical protein
LSDLIVAIPDHRRGEREYILSVVLGDWLGLSFATRVQDDASGTRISLREDPDGRSVMVPDVLLARGTEWLGEKSLPSLPLPDADLADVGDSGGRVPLLFAGSRQPTRAMTETPAGSAFGFDILGALFFLLTRYEEYVRSDARDAHGRFPARDSILWPGGWLRVPVADIYARWLDVALHRLWPRLPQERRPGGIVISHDIDHPGARFRWHGRRRLEAIAADVVKRRDPRLALRRAAGFVPVERVSRHDPYDTFGFLMDVSEAGGRRSTFFVLSADSALPEGSDYGIDDPLVGRVLRTAARRGHGIGLHGSYRSYMDGDRLAAEWRILDATWSSQLPGAIQRSVRQHYLMFRPGATWQAQVAAGFTSDWTLGFADEVGYRAGTSRPFRAFDVLAAEALPLTVRPLHVMDVTLRDHLRLDSTASSELIADMARRTHALGGELSLLWHNSTLETPSARRWYRELVASLPS